ncbi:Sphinganine C(4)-monooxygenase 2 [Apostasia shenzhenica]|uniref:Sphinganine C(4)-monooxygenase 2 n=1 Tax=Apostasia shenzhenica TaxID=1088818 RepID=A0A2H9ZSS8_9ASPA|nr:Sphinganine C(4)-monooxygenase 2 [Apostasia shenzhenica]PKA52037.1 Sphinganine C(4)-monooxygenase 2 [Apostasia shenzhenica]
MRTDSVIPTMELSLTADELRATFVPVAIYWIYSAILEMLEGATAKYSLHSKAEENAMIKMLVPKRSVVKGVLLHQTIQISLSLFVAAVRAYVREV